jgi:sulfite reductase (NADPH) flavoprotein alpha-component
MIEIHIAWGSQSGNSTNLANVIGDSLRDFGVIHIHDMGDVSPEEILTFKHLILVTSTYGDGEAPDNASEWMSYLKFSDAIDLSHLNYAVIGLGDTYYPHFCQAGKDFDQYLSKHGANALLQRLDCDLYFEEQYPEWLEELKSVLKTTVRD